MNYSRKLYETASTRWAMRLLLAGLAVGCSSTDSDDNGSGPPGCPAGYTDCGGQCVNLQGDGANCGACGVLCATGTVCANGTCSAGACPTGTLQCGASCVNPATDPLNCGACGTACGSGMTCSSGTCVGITGTGGTGTGGSVTGGTGTGGSVTGGTGTGGSVTGGTGTGGSVTGGTGTGGSNTGGVAAAGAGGAETGGVGTGGTVVNPSCPGAIADAYQGAPGQVPGTVEAENFDPSGYSDSSTGNEGGAYRTDVDVDIKTLGTGHAIGWMTAGEWLEYTVNVATAGDYTLTVRAGAVDAGRTLEFSSCSTALTGPIAIPQIGAWGEVATTTAASVHLEAGLQVIRVTVGASDYLDFDSFTLDSGAPGTGGTGGVGGTGGTGGTGGATGGTGGVTGGTGGATGGTGGATGGTGGGTTCALPSTFRWTSTGALAQPAGSGWDSLKDFTVTKYNGKYLVYGTVYNGGWNGFFSTFTSFDEFDTAPQNYHDGHVAPTLFYFEPKNIWVLTYQWGFQYKTTTTPDVWSSWSGGRSLLSGDPTEGRGTGPIDQTVICDDVNCYLFFNDDAGGVYRASMPINDFPGTFSNATRILDQPTSVIFEGVQVYSIKGSNQYLMIIENNGTRHFKAWTATNLGGTWTPLAGANTEQSPFAGRANTTWPGGQWTNDISHGDIVRENPSEKMEIDPCNLQLLYQGRDPNVSVNYNNLPYRPGLLTLQR